MRRALRDGGIAHALICSVVRALWDGELSQSLGQYGIVG